MATALPKSISIDFVDLGFRDYTWADYLRFAALIFVPPLAVMGATFLQPWVAPAELLLDPMAIARDPELCCAFYSGAVSNLGIVLWAAAAAVAAFAAWLSRDPHTRRFFAATGAFTTLLMVDDLFMLHEEALPLFGMPEPVVYGVYLVIAGAYGLFFFRRILSARAALAIIAALAMAASVIEDQTKILWPIHDFVEDGAKLGGIYCWFLFVTLRARDAITGAPSQ